MCRWLPFNAPALACAPPTLVMAFPIGKVRRFSFALARIEVAHGPNWALEGSAFRNRFGLRGRTGLFSRACTGCPPTVATSSVELIVPPHLSFLLYGTAELRRFLSQLARFM